jgi:hypothetical protein
MKNTLIVIFLLFNTNLVFASIRKSVTNLIKDEISLESLVDFDSICINEINVDLTLRVLDEQQTLAEMSEVVLIGNEYNQHDIVVNANNGNTAYFRSYNSCEGNGPSYKIVGGIPELNLLFLDRTHGCDTGETLIIVSTENAVMRELKCLGIFSYDQIQISPDNSWCTFSSCDCSMGYNCNMEIISLKNRENDFFESVFFRERTCVCGPIQWLSNFEFKSKTAIENPESSWECDFKDITFILIEGAWKVKR